MLVFFLDVHRSVQAAFTLHFAWHDQSMTRTEKYEMPNADGLPVYVGDSATLSYLQLIRMMVESVTGPSAFTVDPRRHRIMEPTMTLPSNFRPTHLLPHRQTAQVLVNSYFVNVIPCSADVCLSSQLIHCRLMDFSKYSTAKSSSIRSTLVMQTHSM